MLWEGVCRRGLKFACRAVIACERDRACRTAAVRVRPDTDIRGCGCATTTYEFKHPFECRQKLRRVRECQARTFLFGRYVIRHVPNLNKPPSGTVLYAQKQSTRRIPPNPTLLPPHHKRRHHGPQTRHHWGGGTCHGTIGQRPQIPPPSPRRQLHEKRPIPRRQHPAPHRNFNTPPLQPRAQNCRRLGLRPRHRPSSRPSPRGSGCQCGDLVPQ